MDARIIVPSEGFVTSMRHYWTTTLGNTSSEPLEKLWGLMAHTYNEAILFGDADHKWRVLQPPTGSGKTQGSCVYACLLIELNSSAQAGIELPTGMLIVTRTIQQADEVVETIRHLLIEGGMTKELAEARVVAKHSDNFTTLQQMTSADVLVICHSAYVKALSGLHQEQYGRWENYTCWTGGIERRLTIVDEMLNGLIEERCVTTSDVKQVLSAVRRRML